MKGLLSVALISSAACIASQARADAFDFSDFLGVFETCTPSSELAYLQYRDARVYTLNDERYRSAKLADHVEQVLSFRSVAPAEDSVVVTYGLSGTYVNVPVTALILMLGVENGIQAAQLVFDAPRSVVASYFEKGLSEDYGAIPAEEPGSIVCDWST
ncbi:hypothetical protein ACTDI4_02485 [Mesorhizobium sp. PUT5]|uniref:hypothetical protein n=1 Tax=Mesorhizobium sp. PUT5 TaxID=3454629 RepID=UPI003FA4A306